MNKLPMQGQEAGSMDIFKSRLKTHQFSLWFKVLIMFILDSADSQHYLKLTGVQCSLH